MSELLAVAASGMSLRGVNTGPTRRLMIAGLVTLSLSFLLLVALRISTKPLPGDFGFEVMVWLRDITAYIGSGFVVAAVALRGSPSRYQVPLPQPNPR